MRHWEELEAKMDAEPQRMEAKRQRMELQMFEYMRGVYTAIG